MSDMIVAVVDVLVNYVWITDCTTISVRSGKISKYDLLSPLYHIIIKYHYILFANFYITLLICCALSMHLSFNSRRNPQGIESIIIMVTLNSLSEIGRLQIVYILLQLFYFDFQSRNLGCLPLGALTSDTIVARSLTEILKRVTTAKIKLSIILEDLSLQ